VDGEASGIVRVNHLAMGLRLGPGIHRVTLSHRPRGFVAGAWLLGIGVAALGLESFRRRSV
jgi:hypothetical protein